MLSLLPDDILLYRINFFISNLDVISLSLVCKKLSDLRDRISFWDPIRLNIKDRTMWYYNNLKHVILFKDSIDFHPLPKNLDSIALSDQETLQHRLPEGISYVSFSHGSKCSIENKIPNTVRTIKFQGSFKQPIKGHMSKYLKHIVFGSKFNQPIDDCLYEGLKGLIIRGSSLLKDPIPSTVKYLSINQDLEKIIPRGVFMLEVPGPVDNLARDCPDIKILAMKRNKSNRILVPSDIPRNVDYLKLNSFDCCVEGVIPSSVRTLSLLRCSNIYIPSSLKKLILWNCDHLHLNEGIVELNIYYSNAFSLTTNIPSTVRKLNLRGTVGLLSDFNLPPTIKKLVLSSYKMKITPGSIPHGIQKVYIRYPINLTKCIPSSVKSLYIVEFNGSFKDVIPEGVEKLNLRSVFGTDLTGHLPKSLKYLRIYDCDLDNFECLKETNLKHIEVIGIKIINQKNTLLVEHLPKSLEILVTSFPITQTLPPGVRHVLH